MTMAEYRPGTPELRKALKRFYREHDRVSTKIERIQAEHQDTVKTFTKSGKLRFVFRTPVLPEYPAYPEECRGMTCGAKTRKGTPCKQTALYGMCSRCKFHGGMSTGPRTKKGKKRSARNGLRPKRRGKIEARLNY